MAGKKEKKASSKKKECFIIMPISTPKHCLTDYNNDEDHFIHVADHLFIPAIEKAGFKPIKPSARGSENIQARFIKSLSTTDLVLCDMTCLNPNVFYEFGIRTALNKPVCLVKDDKTDKVPFDTSTIHFHTYSSSLNLWENEQEIYNLSEHVKDSFEKSKNENSLWRIFGLRSQAEFPKPDSSEQGKLDLIQMEMKNVKNALNIMSTPLMENVTLKYISSRHQLAIEKLHAWFNEDDSEVDIMLKKSGEIFVFTKEFKNEKFQLMAERIGLRYAVLVKIFPPLEYIIEPFDLA